ncbi:hypothetical protein K1719_041266 [Acacia pycnantha]|nr:hypothetical protein K1719_041266 [Acacia pycnantha]
MVISLFNLVQIEIATVVLLCAGISWGPVLPKTSSDAYQVDLKGGLHIHSTIRLVFEELEVVFEELEVPLLLDLQLVDPKLTSSATYDCALDYVFGWRCAFFVESMLMIPFVIMGFFMKPLHMKGFLHHWLVFILGAGRLEKPNQGVKVSEARNY